MLQLGSANFADVGGSVLPQKHSVLRKIQNKNRKQPTYIHSEDTKDGPDGFNAYTAELVGLHFA